MTRDTRDIDLTALFADDDAVSPVIGVILMVAITVILAAVIGTFVLGLGQQVQTTTPQASFSFDYGSPNVTITHVSGNSIPESQISIAESNTTGTEISKIPADGETYTAGDIVGEGPYNSSETIRVVWTSANGDNSATLQSSQAP